LDAEIAQLVRQFAVSSEAQRGAIEAELTDEHSFGFLVFAERMAALAVRENSVDRLRDGLLSIAMEQFRFDLREDLMVMSLLYNSAKKIGADPDAVFMSVCPAVAPQVARELQKFVSRPAELKSIAAMGYREIDDAAGFRYDRIRNT
jgi:hypothetical protein